MRSRRARRVYYTTSLEYETEIEGYTQGNGGFKVPCVPTQRSDRIHCATLLPRRLRVKKNKKNGLQKEKEKKEGVAHIRNGVSIPKGTGVQGALCAYVIRLRVSFTQMAETRSP